MKQTDKYNNMISAFQCDFSLAKAGEKRLTSLDGLIAHKNSSILNDIELLEELEWKLRNGKAMIMEEEQNE